MDADIAALVAAQEVPKAAALASARGQHGVASELFEQACDFARAADAALASGDAARALALAVVARDDALAQRALDALKVGGQSDALGRVARILETRGDFAWAARAHEARGAERVAAATWERAGEAVRAAVLYERAKDPVSAAKALEAALRRDGSQVAAHLALGALLARYGKHEGAVRALQRVPAESALRREALPPLVHALDALGLSQARDDAARELEALGGALPSSPEVAPASDVVRRLYGRYEVVREVASTATSRVLECIDTVRGERVAVKMFAAWEARGTGRDALARFEREVRVLAALDHPNIVPLRELITEGPAMVLAWMSGGTLETMMQSPLAPARAVEIADAVLRALGEAHRLGVLHRDVKPANVLFDDAGVTRLSDFGVAHLGDVSVTATAAVIGTLAYMSPEQREGKPATVQSDIYGVGAVLFEMLTGERLIAGEEPKTRPSGVHRDLDTRHDAAVMRLLASAPADRPADTFLARRALSALSWPKDVEPAAVRPRAPRNAPSDRPSSARVANVAGTSTDTWTGRVIERVSLTAEALGRASAFARAGHRALQLVLRVDREGESIWLEGAPSRRLDRPLTESEHAFLLVALDSLHAHGAVHGRVDRDHLAMGSEPILLFDARSAPAGTTADTDFAELRRLSSLPAAR